MAVLSGPVMLNRHDMGKNVIYFSIKFVERLTDHILIRDRPLVDPWPTTWWFVTDHLGIRDRPVRLRWPSIIRSIATFSAQRIIVTDLIQTEYMARHSLEDESSYFCGVEWEFILLNMWEADKSLFLIWCQFRLGIRVRRGIGLLDWG